MVAVTLATVRLGGAIQAGGIEEGPCGVTRLLSMRLYIYLWFPGPQLYVHALTLALWANNIAA